MSDRPQWVDGDDPLAVQAAFEWREEIRRVKGPGMVTTYTTSTRAGRTINTRCEVETSGVRIGRAMASDDNWLSLTVAPLGLLNPFPLFMFDKANREIQEAADGEG